MGFMIILEFVVKCFYVVPWTLFALVYPLYASIRAIETNSSSDFRNLVAYWILFSVTFLFEGAFVKLLEWLPFLWPYIKLVIFCWLVLSNFNGAFYVYKHLLHPCITLDIKDLINQFEEKKELFFSRIKVAVDRRYVKENGDEALHEIVANKSKGTEHINTVQKDMKALEVTEKKEVATAEQSKCQEPIIIVQKDMNGVEVSEKTVMATAKQVSLPEFPLPFVLPENKKFEPEEIKRISATATARSDVLELPVSRNVQQQWTCGVCQLTTDSEATRKSHLQGSWHRLCEDQLKAENQPSTSEASTAPEDKKSEDCEVPKQKPLPVQQDDLTNKYVELKESIWRCTICNVSCHTMNNMSDHLNGRKHLAKIRLSNGLVGGHTSTMVCTSNAGF